MMRSRKLLIAVLLALSVGVQLLEASGRWDHTFADANDEAGIVVVALCIGIAIAVAARVLRSIRASHSSIAAIVSSVTAVAPGPAQLVAIHGDSPPLSLRI
jgi:hypothetical protein